MKPWALLKKLYQVNLIKPRGVCRLIHSFWMDGFNLMAILRFVSRQYPNYIAITDDKETISYKELFIQTLNVACCLQEKYNIGTKQKGIKRVFSSWNITIYCTSTIKSLRGCRSIRH